MDDVQVIDIYKSKLTPIRIPEGFVLSPKGRFAKLQQRVWNWAVAKGLIVNHFITGEKVTRVAVRKSDLFDRLMDQYETIMLSMRDPEVVLMGPDTFRKMMRLSYEIPHDTPFGLTATGYVKRYRDQKAEIFNLPVRVIPHMEGCLILDRA